MVGLHLVLCDALKYSYKLCNVGSTVMIAILILVLLILIIVFKT